VADIAVLFAAFAFCLAAVSVVVFMTPAARRKRRLAAEIRKRRVSPGADDLDSYLKRLAQAGSDEEIDRLERGEG
jgi:hypothetical protein